MTQRLIDRIKTQILSEGPMGLDTYMRLCLADPEQGYYTNNYPIGRGGDFITAPEISQLFGEMLAIWVIDCWQKLARPRPWSLIEAGPGRGTLMADMLRVISKLAPECASSLSVRLIEVSETLKKQQQTILQPFTFDIRWQSCLDDLGQAPFIFIANEFLDALPIRQYQFEKGQWWERAVGLTAQGQLSFGLKATAFQGPDGQAPLEGQIFEVCLAAQSIVEYVSTQIRAHGGAALFIDYGHFFSGFGETLQAVKKHQFTDPLQAPGQADLTAHVDFGALQKVVARTGLKAQLTNQGDFLLAMGIVERAGKLGQALDPAAREKIRHDVERLAAPEKMGKLFKLMAINRSDMTPHGF